MGKPALALAAVIHAMAVPLLYVESHGSCLDLQTVSAPLDRLTKSEDDSPAHASLRQTCTFWSDRLPGSADDLLAWCLSQPQETLLDLLTFVAALTVDAVESKGTGRKARSGCSRAGRHARYARLVAAHGPRLLATPA